MSLNVAFNGNSLQTFDGSHGIIVQKIHHAGKSNKQAQTYALSHGNKSAIPFVEYPNKPITLTGEIIGTSIADYQKQVDTFNSLLTAQNANLDFDYAGGTLNRRYTATCTNIDVVDGDLPNYGVFNVTFTAVKPFGQDVSATQLLVNLLPNSDFEVNTTGWAVFNGSTITQSTAHAQFGTHSLSVATTSGANRGAETNAIAVSPSTTYTMSAYVWVPTGQTLSYEVDQYNGGSSYIGNAPGIQTIAGNNNFQRITLTFTTLSNAASIQVFYYLNATTTFYIDGVQLELGSSASSYSKSGISQTTASASYNILTIGSAPWQSPIITVTLTTIGSSPVSGTVSIGNNATGQQVQITRTWTNGDVLVIDTTLDNNTPITVNGSPTEWTGALPIFFTGAGVLDYSDTFASRTYSIVPIYYKNYL